jgi:NH3-dependent NAD+ synthetase
MEPYMKTVTMTTPEKFHQVVQWLVDEILIAKTAPGLIIGLSGTDSIVAYLAAYRALDRVNKAHRLLGVHFAPSQEFLDDYPEAETHRWFSTEIIPWLRKQAPHANVEVDTSIDWRFDGLRWGTLADRSVMYMSDRKMRPSDDKYWILGTRNRTEEELNLYSVASTIASVQPIIRLYKSEILDICEWLEVPQLVINKSCEEDCICGREELRAKFGRELDWMLGRDERSRTLNPFLKQKLEAYINERLAKGRFKKLIPYEP